jgi:hypothetical protein
MLLPGLVVPVVSHAQPLQPRSVRSVSGQFTVNDARSRPASPVALRASTNANFLRLEPPLVSVSCERIKQVLCRELDVSHSWNGKIFLVLYPASSTNENVLISAERFTDGWHYRVALPDVISRVRYVTAITQVLLTEMADRKAAERSTEVPPWLVHGLSRHILSSSELEVILPPPRDSGSVSASFVVGKKENPLAGAHRELSANKAPLTFQELSWPEDNSRCGVAGEVFGYSAQLFVSELLRLSKGRESMRQMVAELPQFYNWQFAFLRAYRGSFQRPLDVEKWWALHLAHFTGHQLEAERWSAEDSWKKLAELVRPVVQVHAQTNQSPQYAAVRLQTIIRDWERGPQTQALQEKISQLQMLRLRVAPELYPAVDSYLSTIETYIQDRDRTSLLPFRRQAIENQAAAEAVKRLDALDARHLISHSVSR